MDVVRLGSYISRYSSWSQMGNKAGYKVIVGLSILAMILSIFLTYAHYNSAGIACPAPVPGEESSCDLVNHSIYAEIFGFPVAMIGFLGYMVIGFMALVGLGKFKPKGDLLDDLSERPAFYLVLLSLGGVLFTLYLNYVQIFLIGRICFLCEISATIILLVLITSILLWRKEIRCPKNS